MLPRDLIKSLIYLDRGFIADLYEVGSNEPALTTITKSQGKKASGALPIFSAEVSVDETRTFSVSTLQMLVATWKTLNSEPVVQAEEFSSGMGSLYGWVEGQLSVFQAKSTVQRSSGQTEVTGESDHYILRHSGSMALSLITTPEYFSSGLGTLVKLQKTVLKEMSIPVRAYVRVLGAHDHFKQFIAVPLLLLERRGDTREGLNRGD